MLFDILVIVIALISLVISQPYYDIPSYYGHFSQRYFLESFLSAGNMALLEYHFGVDVNYQNDTVFYANSQMNCIYKYSIASQTIEVLVGQCGTAGSVVGSKDVALFNGPKSVAYYR